tara:strand:- start:373 stop:492 length:120 start_codon:yes stop_codon:yes gene_type:complete
MKIPKNLVFTTFTVGEYEIYIFQDPEGELITLKVYEYEY